MLKKVCDICGKEVGESESNSIKLSINPKTHFIPITVSITSLNKSTQKAPVSYTYPHQIYGEYRDFCLEHQREILQLAIVEIVKKLND